MLKLKALGAGLAAGAIMVLSPMAAYADCNGCYGGCIETYGEDNTETGYYWLSVCLNSCLDDLGRPCMGTIG
jgi:hypothetical protein